MCLNRKRITRYYPGLGKYVNQYFPCGHCVECLRQKQNATAFLVSRQAQESGNLFFLTFTYAPEHLPFAHVEQVFDVDSGQLIETSQPAQICDIDYPLGLRYDKAICFKNEPSNHRSREYRWYRRNLLAREDLIRQDYLARFGRTAIEPFLFRSVETDDFRICGYATPTLRTSDVQLVIKLFRTRCKRSGVSLEGFKFFVCGEYGTKSGRPHYHLAVHGISETLVKDLCSLWESRFGSTYIDNVPFDATTRVGDYIGKYLTKGEFDKPFVRDGYCKKGRRQSCQNYGLGNLSALRNWMLGFDLFGRYDVSDVRTYPRPLNRLIDTILSRNYCFINGIRYAIPRILKRKVFYVQTYKMGEIDPSSPASDPKCKKTKVYRPSALSKISSRRLQSGYLDDFDFKLRQSAVHYSSEDVFGPGVEVTQVQKLCDDSRAATLIQDLRTFYSRSLF